MATPSPGESQNMMTQSLQELDFVCASKRSKLALGPEDGAWQTWLDDPQSGASTLTQRYDRFHELRSKESSSRFLQIVLARVLSCARSASVPEKPDVTYLQRQRP